MAKKKKKSKKQQPSDKSDGANEVDHLSAAAPAAEDGTLTPEELRRFHAIVEVLSGIATTLEQPGAKWIPQSHHALPCHELADLLLKLALPNIESIAQDVEAGRHDGLIRKSLGRRLTMVEKKVIRSWKNYITGQFMVVDHIPNKGSVLLQIYSFDPKGKLCLCQPRLFLVRGLGITAQKNSCVQTTLLPFCGGLTYLIDKIIMQPKEMFIAEATRLRAFAPSLYDESMSGSPGALRIYTLPTEDDFISFRQEDAALASDDPSSAFDAVNRDIPTEKNPTKPTSRRKQCAYCGLKEEEKLSQCPCMTVYYCCVEHQRSHWKQHKKECSAARKKH